MKMKPRTKKIKNGDEMNAEVNGLLRIDFQDEPDPGWLLLDVRGERGNVIDDEDEAARLLGVADDRLEEALSKLPVADCSIGGVTGAAVELVGYVVRDPLTRKGFAQCRTDVEDEVLESHPLGNGSELRRALRDVVRAADEDGAGSAGEGSVVISVYGSGSSTRSTHAEDEDEEVRC